MREHQVRVPKLGLTMEEAELLEWHVSEGDKVHKDAELATIQTDKLDVALECPCTGTVVQIIGLVGTIYSVGEILCVVAEE